MKRSLRALLPSSLRPRLILLVLGTALVAQAATLTAITHYQRKYLDSVAVGLIATTISTLRAALAHVPPENRAEFVRLASGNQWRLYTRPAPTPEERAAWEARRAARRAAMGPDLEAGDRLSLRHVVRRLNEHLGQGTRVGLSRGPRPELYISLSGNAAGQSLPQVLEWLVVPLDRVDPPLTTPLVALWLGGLGVVLLVAVGFSWHISRPITQLARAADNLAAGRPERVQPSGPRETRVLGERFNAMLDALAEADSVRRTLLAGLPHDLKGPLSRMWLRVEMTDDETLRGGLRKDLQDMQHMVDQFIGFVRGTDPGAYRFSPLDLTEWLRERVAAWSDAGSGVMLAGLPDKSLTARADPVALGRLLDNLIGNALHHGAPPVQVRLTADDGQALLEVADHGPGIAPERRADALRPFMRLDDARTRTGNVGLGLALAQAIAHAHGGSLALGQADSGGLLVSVRLPLAT